MGNSNGRPIDLSAEANLNHFRLLRVVGKGAFGKVRIVERKDSGLSFALKYIRKDEVVRSESVKNIIRERHMLQHLNHPFLCNLRYTFQDVEYMYIVVDLMNGGDLRFHITRKTFTEDAVRFWIAELGCALRYVHKQGIVHRDIKPDNVLLDAEGHVHLGDFNVATNIVPGKPCSSRSGTLAYLAPEVYSGRGYYSECDWWSLGVLFYECIFNKRPFIASHHEELAQLIMRAEPPFPNTSPPVSNPCLHAISSLLEKNKRARIGAAGFGTFTDNPFFRDIDFGALERKEIEPVFVPSSDKTNFDATYDLEELLLEEAPLEARARRQKPRPGLRNDATPQEIQADKWHRYIERNFLPFDYTQLPQERAPVDPDMKCPGSTSGRQTPSQPSPRDQDVVSTSARERQQMRPASEGQPLPKETPRRKSEDLLREKPRSKKRRFFPGERSTTNNTSNSSGIRTAYSTRSSLISPSGSPQLLATTMMDATIPPTSFLDSSTPPILEHEAASNTRTESTIMPRSIPETDPRHEPDLKLTHSRTMQLDFAPSSSTWNQSVRSQRPRAPMRSASMGGIVLDDTRNRSADSREDPDRRGEKPSGVLSFFNRKKGRDRSPRARDRERGVLGKEGARVVVKD